MFKLKRPFPRFGWTTCFYKNNTLVYTIMNKINARFRVVVIEIKIRDPYGLKIFPIKIFYNFACLLQDFIYHFPCIFLYITYKRPYFGRFLFCRENP